MVDGQEGVSEDEDGVLRIGLIADVQYADREDGSNFSGTIRRRYRNALCVLGEAIHCWQTEQQDFVVQLGDLVDRSNSLAPSLSQVSLQNKKTSKEERLLAFQTILDKLKELGDTPVYHVIGNHDLYNFSKSDLVEILQMQAPYYEFTPKPGWRCICLDGYGVSILDRGDQKSFAQGYSVLKRENPTNWEAWEEGSVNFQQGLEGEKLRFVPFNGAFGDEQLQWFQSCLSSAREQGERVVILSHLPLLPDAELVRFSCVPWDYQTALDLIDASNANVVAVFAGHDHAGGVGIQETSSGRCILHYTLLGAVESTTPQCHVNVTLDPKTGVKVQGFGSATSYTL